MLNVLLEFTAVVLGIGLLVWGANQFIDNAVALAQRWGVSTIIIGLTVVAFGTSAPELFVSTMAALQGNRDIGIGNAVGSNVTNIALVLGATAVIVAIPVHGKLFRMEFPMLLVNTGVLYFLLADGVFNRVDGMVLLLMLATNAYVITYAALSKREISDLVHVHPASHTVKWMLVGLASLLISAEILVWGAEHLAKRIGVSDLVIGLTVVALGTSLPELAASLAGAIKKHHGLAIGNIIGSNIFNISAAMAMPALIHPGPVNADLLNRDYWIMAGLTLSIPVLAFAIPTKPGQIGRTAGILLLSSYGAYCVMLYMTS